jgi:hypothetical protein
MQRLVDVIRRFLCPRRLGLCDPLGLVHGDEQARVVFTALFELAERE